MQVAEQVADRLVDLLGALLLVTSGWAGSGLFASGFPGVGYLIVGLAERTAAVGASACREAKIASSRPRSGIGSVQGRAGTTQRFVCCGCVASV